MAMRSAPVATLSFLCLSGVAAADVNPPVPLSYESGENLLVYCSAEPGTRDAQYCTGYIVAIADAMPRMRTDGDFHGALYACAPRGLIQTGLVGVVKTWLISHPQDRQGEAAPLVAKALAESFPCKPAN